MSPFDELGPPALASRAAEALQAELLADGVPAAGLNAPGGGKMLGVLVVEDRDGRCGFLRAFSGTLDGRFDVDGWAPPIFDRAARAAVEPAGERVVKELLARAAALASSDEVVGLRRAQRAMSRRHASALAEVRERHHQRRAVRRRHASIDAGATTGHDDAAEVRARASRRDKAERRALVAAQAAERRDVDTRLRRIDRRLGAFERLRRMVCRRLMQRIHDTYRVPNAAGAVRGLRELYAPGEPPTGAGDCVAPKLLVAAFRRGLRPLAMAEFWWGAPPPSGGRVAGAFSPACLDKCGPLLPWMLEGLDVAPARRFEAPDPAALALPVVFADDWIVVVDKPCGLLSVPARSGRPNDSVEARLRRDLGAPLLVHRLDLDTSGLLVVARDPATYAALQRQFLTRTVEKRYAAIVDGEVDGDGGIIDFPLRVDLHDRPRQIHDPVHGRSAVTAWRSLGGAGRGRTRIAFFPRSGRTHQLRVHASHPLGLGAPIVGDRLYGHPGGRLLLHAEQLTLDHPATGARMTFRSAVPF